MSNVSFDRSELDDAVVTLTHVYIMGAQYLLDTMTKAVHYYCLQNDLKPEVKKKLKQDLDFTSKAVQYLTQAHKDYDSMIRHIDLIETELNKRLNNKTDYTAQVVNMHDLLSVSLMYLSIGQDKAKADKFHAYMQKYNVPESIASAYKLCRENALKMWERHINDKNR